MKRTRLSYIIDSLLVVMFLATAFIGVLMGFVMTRDEDVLWRQNRHEWGYIHFLTAVCLVVLIIVHFALHWEWLKRTSRAYAPRSFVAWSGVVIFIAAAIIYAGSVATPPGAYAGARRGLRLQSEADLGARIYYTGAGENGKPVSFAGGPSWVYTRGGACVDCHGRDGRGGGPFTGGGLSVPDIRYRVLIGKELPAQKQPKRAPYTEATIQRAIIGGAEADGTPMGPDMPRYELSDNEAGALIAFLKRLGE